MPRLCDPHCCTKISQGNILTPYWKGELKSNQPSRVTPQRHSSLNLVKIMRYELLHPSVSCNIPLYFKPCIPDQWKASRKDDPCILWHQSEKVNNCLFLGVSSEAANSSDWKKLKSVHSCRYLPEISQAMFLCLIKKKTYHASFPILVIGSKCTIQIGSPHTWKGMQKNSLRHVMHVSEPKKTYIFSAGSFWHLNCLTKICLVSKILSSHHCPYFWVVASKMKTWF